MAIPGEALAKASARREGRATQHRLQALVADLKVRYRDRITGEVTVPARPARHAEFPDDLDPRIVRALRARGVERLYHHQRRAWDCVQRGRHTALVTPTASGKTLCYNLPVLHAVLRERAKALYLFPTKALSQDQVAELCELNEAGGLGLATFTFDGDTPGDARKAVRTRGDVVVTNPDMLHQGILPHHTKWAQFLESLRYVVIDEMHTYRGVFGAHMANVIRRLKRVAQFYGVQPVFILCSATIANPGELAARLVEDEVETLTESGAPHGERHLLLWNPPVVNPELGIRASARSQSARIARLAIKANLKTIVFARTRLMVEVLTKYLKDAFDKDPRRPSRVRAYRGGYLPGQRRRTERELRSGAVDCVVATSALELGVDIGALDVCLLNGYPGTVAGTWQRLGRAGRRLRPALGVLVATSWPLDQYIVRHPDYFLGAAPEHARIDPDQLLIFLDHVRCAAFELAFRDGERYGGRDIGEFLAYLQEEGLLHHEANRWHWMADSYPANSVSLRSVAEGNFVVIDTTDGRKDVIAEVDYASAPMTLYEGAIYMVQARPWQVERLDWEGRKAFVRETRADYYTDAIDYTRLKILDEFEQERSTHASCGHGEVHLVRRVAGYKKIRYYTHENVGWGTVNLPDHEMHTTAAWWQADPAALDEVFASRWQALDGFLGAAYAMHFVAALLTMSEPQDLGRAVGNSDASWSTTAGLQGHPQTRSHSGERIDVHGPEVRFRPTVFLYDNYPGGIGFSGALYELREGVVRRAYQMIADCGCVYGCPACVGPILAHDESAAQGPKNAALIVLTLLAGGAISGA
ncbi:MAG: DEAD/DEAH box helicase [Gammaproteobacteria bacterium]|nr:DEAD/DEAH box helicase [Gammaproteobacteria bacterium]NIR85297.1 DEAD/DEAH box helicase [Gammaproteobacteria bacterium]NIR88413.1 DEAD/DEAH box helicase [Gammaproteobacteria bacterium]NIU06363.1 DEAD/DEAH box helicase [Gammaproteobacteria bacterium]NIV53262.1 DEAD/DEAH box helicase [Gammaproteobacteria bacterium]